MKFNVSSSKLFSQLQAVSRVINSKNALPILDDVLFDLVGNELKLTASDGETTIRTSIEVDGVEGTGKVASAARATSGHSPTTNAIDANKQNRRRVMMAPLSIDNSMHQ